MIFIQYIYLSETIKLLLDKLIYSERNKYL